MDYKRVSSNSKKLIIEGITEAEQPSGPAIGSRDKSKLTISRLSMPSAKQTDVTFG